jgi:hypothetical protein
MTTLNTLRSIKIPQYSVPVVVEWRIYFSKELGNYGLSRNLKLKDPPCILPTKFIVS